MKGKRSAVLTLALLLDMLFGDPPNRFHPVAWMGSQINATTKLIPRQGKMKPFLGGAGAIISGATIWACFGFLLEKLGQKLPAPIAIIIEAICLKMTFSMRGLSNAAMQVQDSLEMGDLKNARHWLSWHLVSRNTDNLSESQVAAATVESVAENTSDGIIAPLFYYTIAGLPGAFAYRFSNTADAMLGYHDAEHEWLGKAPARLDDIANFVPARLTTWLFLFATALIKGNVRHTWHILQRDGHNTASPNAGLPMSTMAGALGVELEKTNHYKLGAGQKAAQKDDIKRSLQLSGIAVIFGVVLTWVAALFRDKSK